MDHQTQIDRLIELAIVQRTELQALVQQLPILREHLNAEIEKNLEVIEPQIKKELEEFCLERAVDANARLGLALEVKIAEVAKSLEASARSYVAAVKAEIGRAHF